MRQLLSYYLVMDTDTFSIAEIADHAGISRRAVRFYIQEGLLDPPEGAGRGSHYERAHLERLQRIVELQRAGHSLDAMKRIFAGKPVPPPEPARPIRGTTLRSSLMTRVELIEGVEIQFDASRFSPASEDLLAFQELARKVFRS
jgi:DNA-binding transcriptional MerR regulator